MATICHNIPDADIPDRYLFYRIILNDIVELFCQPFISYTLKRYSPNKMDYPSSVSKIFLGVIMVTLMSSIMAHHSSFLPHNFICAVSIESDFINLKA